MFSKTFDIFGDQSLIVIGVAVHTPGELALLVILPNVPFLLAGDEVLHFDWLYSDDIQKVSKSLEIAAEFRNLGRSLRKGYRNLVVLMGHDTRSLTKAREDLIIENELQVYANYWPIN